MTTDQPTAPRGRDTQKTNNQRTHWQNTYDLKIVRTHTNKAKQPTLSSSAR